MTVRNVAFAVAALTPVLGTTQAAPDSPTADPLAVQLVDQTFAVRHDGSLNLSVELTGLTGAEPNEATVTVTVHDTVADVAALAAADDGDLPQRIDSVIVPAERQTWLAGDTEAVTAVLSLPPDDVELGDAGIHPMVVNIDVGSQSTSSTTFIDVVDDDRNGQAPLATSILVSIDDPGPWPSPDDRSRAIDDIDRLAEVADAVDGPLSIDLPAGAVTAQMTVDSGATELSDAFRGDELIAGPTVPLDPSAFAAVDLTGLFTLELRNGEDMVSTAIPRAVVSRAVWFADQPLSAAGAAMLRDLGIRMVVMTGDVASALGVQGGADLFEVEVGRAGTLPAMSISSLGVHLDSAGEPSPNHRAVRLAAEARLHHDSTGAPAMVLASPGVGVPDAATTARFAELVAESPDLMLVPISRLPLPLDGSTGADRPPPVVLPERAGADLTARLASIDAARDDAAHANSMLTDASRNAAWQTELNALLSTTVDDDGAQSRLDTVMAEVDAVLEAIDPPEPFTFTTTGTSSTLRLRLENTAPEPLEVIVHPRSAKLRFPESRPRVEIPALGAEVVDIPVEARSNGTFTILVDVMAPDGHEIAGPVVITARVNRFTGLSRVLTGGAVLVLASWWFSHLRRNRRRRAATTGGLDIHGPPTARLDVSPDAAETLAPERSPDAESASGQPG